MSPRAAVIYSPRYYSDIGPHVFPVEKFRLLHEQLIHAGDVPLEEVIEPAPASREELLQVHTPAYLEDLERLRWTERTAMSELPLSHQIVHAYVLMAGGTVRAAREALARGAGINLGGGFHHAFADRASGFCYINDIAVAIRALQREGRIRRAAVVDLDVHQGNGTAVIFQRDRDVFTFSMHQEHLYPVKEISDLDIGLDDHIGDEDYLALLATALPRVLEAHEPELVVYQAGADPYQDDQLGSLGLTMDGLERRDRAVLEGCARLGIPVVVTLGGGYARRVSDTVRIHLHTCRVALGLGAPPRAPA
jgi:acetoin utilization deacetylase AcuC-like enzyme